MKQDDELMKAVAGFIIIAVLFVIASVINYFEYISY